MAGGGRPLRRSVQGAVGSEVSGAVSASVVTSRTQP